MRRGFLVVAGLALAAAGCGDTTNVTVVAPTSKASGAPRLAVYRVPSASMEPTVPQAGPVFVNREGTPQVGAIIVFHPPQGAEEGNGPAKCGPTPHVVIDGTEACSTPVPQAASALFAKRIVAGPGDTITIREGHVFRDGVAEKDSYIRQCAEQDPKCDFPKPITIPADHWFTLGDNRGESDDSRFWGPVPTSWIVGVVRWCGAVGTACRGE